MAHTRKTGHAGNGTSTVHIPRRMTVDWLGLVDGGRVEPHLSTTRVAVCHLLLDADSIPAAVAIRDDAELR